MKSQILEVAIIINGKRREIINSEMQIHLEWEAEIVKKTDSFSLNLIMKELKGFLEFTDIKDYYKKRNIIEFSSNSNWSINYQITREIDYLKVEPLFAQIDFDEKKIKIEF